MLEVKISGNNDGKPNTIYVEVNNLTNSYIHLIYWRTPFDIDFHNFLTVTQDDGYRAQYIGPHAKYGFDPKLSIICFDPGEVKRSTLDLSGRYDVRFAGVHTIEVRDDAWLAFLSESRALPTSLNSAELVPIGKCIGFVVLDGTGTAEISGINATDIVAPPNTSTLLDIGTLKQAAPRCPPEGFCLPPGYSDQGGVCDVGARYIAHPRIHNLSDPEIALIRDLVVQLSIRLRTVPLENSPTFNKWFGPYSSASRQTVAEVYRSIGGGACVNYEIYYIAGVTDIFAAFLRRPAGENRTNAMAVYSLFMRAASYGIDSKCGTIAHELTHGYASTDDAAYGTVACARLAATDPQRALKNADNFEYFLEETILK